MYFLVIKGSLPDALAASASRNIPLYPINRASPHNETWAYTDSNWEPVSDWFCSDAGVKPPFENGSLLWYREATAKEQQQFPTN